MQSIDILRTFFLNNGKNKTKLFIDKQRLDVEELDKDYCRSTLKLSKCGDSKKTTIRDIIMPPFSFKFKLHCTIRFQNVIGREDFNDFEKIVIDYFEKLEYQSRWKCIGCVSRSHTIKIQTTDKHRETIEAIVLETSMKTVIEHSVYAILKPTKCIACVLLPAHILCMMPY